ncbi:hypothetical protein HD554DRAFT_2044378 [Boletus coccyginus]|nr:hypothetical protein HD554DRAFT_2044378 [Boletus coccyginus]
MDHTIVEAFTKHWSNHSSFKIRPIDCLGYPTFTVNYFNRPVIYSSEDFLDCNLDSLNSNFILLLRGSTIGVVDSAEGARSVNPFIKGLFSGKAIMTQAHPKNGDTIVQQPVKPMCTQSTHCGADSGRVLHWYKEPLAKMGVGDASVKEKVEQTKDAVFLLDKTTKNQPKIGGPQTTCLISTG